MKILVVDDDTMIRDLVVTALTYCVNREVKSFDNGLAVWDYLCSGQKADIVISDVEMPGMNGFELMAKVRQKYPDMAFIIMSGVAVYEKKSKLEGADAFLAKPFEINDLFKIVQSYVVDSSRSVESQSIPNIS